MKSLHFNIKEQSIGWLEWDQPNSSVNMLSPAFLEELSSLLNQIEKNKPKVLVLVSKKPNNFCSGVDIKKIQNIQTKKEMHLVLNQIQNLFFRFEQLEFSKIAAIQGPCLGGGLEWALCFDYRLIAKSPHTQLALPEVHLGLIPGLGGCLRLPRLIGLKQSLTMILTGKSLNSKQAYKIALADETIPPLTLEKRALELAKDIINGHRKAHPKTDYKYRKPYSFFIEKIFKSLIYLLAKKQIIKKTKGFYPAPLKALELIQKSYGSFITKKTLEIENQAFCEIHQTSEAKQLIRLWAMTKKAKSIAPDKSSTPQKSIERIGILGAGVMGRSIAYLFANQGFTVRLVDNNTQSLCSALAWAEKLWEQQKQTLNSYELKQKMSKLSLSTNFWGFSSLDLLIEALPENKGLKQNVIRDVSKKLNPHCLFASNTSSLSISELAKNSLHPEKFFGLHFFNPAHKMPLTEIILTDEQKRLYLHPISSLLKTAGKIPLFVKDSPGFIVNKLLSVYLVESLWLFEEGCEIGNIDHCYKNQFGLPLGPFELMDKIGLGICMEIIAQLSKIYPHLKTPQWTEQLVQILGQGEKSGEGFYIHYNNKKSLNEKTKNLERTHQKFPLSHDKIVKRGIYRMINEGKKLLEDRIVQSEEDIDLALILGIGFPPFLGGPMSYGKNIGMSNIKRELEELSNQYGPRFKPHF